MSDTCVPLPIPAFFGLRSLGLRFAGGEGAVVSDALCQLGAAPSAVSAPYFDRYAPVTRPRPFLTTYVPLSADAARTCYRMAVRTGFSTTQLVLAALDFARDRDPRYASLAGEDLVVDVFDWGDVDWDANE